MPTDYSNPQLPEGINNSDRHPLRHFAVLAIAVTAVAALLVLGLTLAAGWIASSVPFEVEQRLAAPYAAQLEPRPGDIEPYLQGLATRLETAMALPQGMTVTLHYAEAPLVNAFATLGGHVVIYKGLLARMPDENTLAMVIAHEIGHVLHRHPIAALGRGVAFGAAVGVLSTGAGSRVVDPVLGSSGLLTLLSFSRGQEEEADQSALAALVRVYGHAGGAPDTFETLARAAAERGRAEPSRLLSTHPLSRERIARMESLIAQRGWQRDGQRARIPEAVRAALAAPEREKPARPAD